MQHRQQARSQVAVWPRIYSMNFIAGKQWNDSNPFLFSSNECLIKFKKESRRILVSIAYAGGTSALAPKISSYCRGFMYWNCKLYGPSPFSLRWCAITRTTFGSTNIHASKIRLELRCKPNWIQCAGCWHIQCIVLVCTVWNLWQTAHWLHYGSMDFCEIKRHYSTRTSTKTHTYTSMRIK